MKNAVGKIASEIFISKLIFTIKMWWAYDLDLFVKTVHDSNQF